MSKPTLAFTRNWVVATIGDLATYITDYEIYALISKGIGEVMHELGKQLGMLKTSSITWDGSTGMAVPDDVIIIPTLTRYNSETGKNDFIDILDPLAIADRAYYGNEGMGYAYMQDRKIYCNWTVTASETLTLYYFRYESDIDVTSSNSYDWTSDNVPAFCETVVRYYVLYHLMSLHGRTQRALQKKLEWMEEYRLGIERLTRTMIGMQPNKNREKRGF